MAKVNKRSGSKGKTMTKKTTAKPSGLNYQINATMTNKLAAKAKELGVRGGAKAFVSKLIKDAI